MSEIKVKISAENQASGPVRDVKNDIDGLEGQTKSGTAGLAKYAAGFVSVAAAMKAASVAADIFKQGVMANIAIDSSLMEVQTLLGDTAVDMAKMKSGLLDLGVSAGQSMDALTKGLYDSVSAGVEFADALDFMGDAAVLAKAGLVDIGTSVDHLTSVMNAYGLEASDMADLNDSIFTAVKGGKTTVEELSGAIGQLAPITKAAGISIDGMYASVATVTKAGISTAQAVTGIRAAINSLLAPGKDAAEEMHRLGINIDSQRFATEGLLPVMQELYQKTGGNFEAMQKLVPTVEALPALFALMSNGASELGDQMDNMADKTGAAATAHEQMSSTIQSQLDSLDANWTRFTVRISESHMPKLEGALRFVGNVLNELGGGADNKYIPTYTNQIHDAKEKIKELNEELKKVASKPNIGPGAYWIRSQEIIKITAAIEDQNDVLQYARGKQAEYRAGQDAITAAAKKEADALAKQNEINEKSAAATAAAAAADLEAAAAAEKRTEAEKGLAKELKKELKEGTKILSDWKSKLSSLESAHKSAMSKMKAAQKDYHDAVKSMAQEEFDYQSSLYERKQKGFEAEREALEPDLAGTDADPEYYEFNKKRYGEERANRYRDDALVAAEAVRAEKELLIQQKEHTAFREELARREAEAMTLTGEEKIAALKSLQTFRTENADSYVTETGKMVKADQAQKEAYAEVDRYQKIIMQTHANLVTQRITAIGDINAELTGLKEEMEATKEIISALTPVVQTIRRELEKGVDMDDTVKELQKVKEELSEIMELSTAEIEWNIDVTMTSSPKRPFSDGIKYLKEKLQGLPSGQEFNVAAGGIPSGGVPASNPTAASVKIGGAANMNATINVVAGEGADGAALADEIEKELSLRWKDGRSTLKKAMEN